MEHICVWVVNFHIKDKHGIKLTSHQTLTSMLSASGYKIKKTDVDVDRILKELTVRPRTLCMTTNDTAPEEYCVCLQNKKYLFVPKCFGLSKFGVPEVIDVAIPKEVTFDFCGSLMDVQKEPVSKYLLAAHDPLKMGGILQLPPGFGKTVLALYIASVLKVKTVVIVHKEFLMNQWIERIHQYLPRASVGILKQTKVETDNDIVVASLQSICMREYSVDTFSDFGLMIIDECHHIGAPVFCKALTKIGVKYTLGLSATVERKDGLSKVFKWHIGDIIYKIAKKDNVQCGVKICKFKNKTSPSLKEVRNYNGQINISRMINDMCNCKERTRFISNIVLDILKLEPTRNCIILSDRRQHLIDISELFESNIEFGFYVGGMKNDDLEISKTKQVILGTYNMVSEGFDLPKLDTLILASSKSDVEQSVGRIQRKHTLTENDNIPLVIDVVDSISVFGRQAAKRLTFYKKRKYEIKD